MVIVMSIDGFDGFPNTPEHGVDREAGSMVNAEDVHRAARNGALIVTGVLVREFTE